MSSPPPLKKRKGDAKRQRGHSLTGGPHPLRQTSFPPETSESPGPRSPDLLPPSVPATPATAVADERVDEEDEDAGDDYGYAGVGTTDEAEEKVKMEMLLRNFDGEQMKRYETYRRAGLNRSAIKKIANQALGQSITPHVAIVIAGFGKVFVGEMVEGARAVQSQWGDAGPLTPEHIKEAYRRYEIETGLITESARTVRFR